MCIERQKCYFAFFCFSMEEKNIQVSLESKRKRKNQLTASRSNRLRRFGDRMPELLESIDKAHAQGRFIKKPVGPIGDRLIYNGSQGCVHSWAKKWARPKTAKH